nr:hypothetical protein [Tanacetum cinerariifolium]
GVAEVPTGSGSIPTAAELPTGSDVVLTAGPIFATATVVTPYTRRKGKETMVESETPKKSSKEEAERFKKKGIRFEQESTKKLKTSEEVPKVVKSPDEIPEEKVKEMMQLVPIEEVYVQVKHLIIDWKHLDREDLNQLWALVNESLNIRPDSSDKEMKLWVELKRLYEPDVEDQLWNHTQNMMHARVEWKLYDSCGVHHKKFPLPVKKVPTAEEKQCHCCEDCTATKVRKKLSVKVI